MFGMPSLSLSAGGGGPSGASANNGISTLLDTAFNFDSSGWVVNAHSSGVSTTATGNKDANQSSQSATPGLSGAVGGISTTTLLIGAMVLFLVLRH